MTIELSDAIDGSPVPDPPLVSTDVVPLIRDGAVYKLAITNFMLLDASNATLPTARTNLGLGTANTPQFGNLGLGVAASSSRLLISGTSGEEIATLTYGSVGTPFPIDPIVGHVGFRTTHYTSHTGLTDSLAIAIAGESHLSEGTYGISVGGFFRGFADGTWSASDSPSAGALGVWAEARSSRGGPFICGAEITAHADTTDGGGVVGIEVDIEAEADIIRKYGIAINSGAGDTGTITGTATVANSAAVISDGAYLLMQNGGGSNFPFGLMSILRIGGVAPIAATGSLWRAGGYTIAKGLDWGDMVFTGPAIDAGGTIQLNNSDVVDLNVFAFRNNGAGDGAISRIASQGYNDATHASIDFVNNSLSNFHSTIAFSTTMTGALTERARFGIDTGNFLINTTTDIGTTEKLQVYGGALTVRPVTTQENFLVLQSASAADGAKLSITQKAYQGLEQSRIDFIANSNGDLKSGIAFATSDGGGQVEKARFAVGTGNFLIGTTTDAGGGNLLQVNGLAKVTTLNATSAIQDNGTAPTGTAGSGYVRATSPTFVTPVLGAASATSITGLNAPSAASDAVNKTYADAIASGIVTHASAVAATTVNLTPVTLSGAGVGKTITNNGTQAAFAVDGVSPSINDRILVKDQTTQKDNGIYALTTVGSGATNWVLTRVTDFDAASASEVAVGASVIIVSGSANARTQWVETGQGPFTVDTTAIVFDGITSAASGIVNSGTTNQLAHYASNGTTITGLTTGNSGVLVTSSGGVPSISSTLPSALSIPSPTFTGTVAGAGTIPNSVLANSTVTIGSISTALGATSLALVGVTSYNKVAITAPATGSTLTIADGKTLTANNSIALTGTDTTVMTFPTTSKTLAANDYSNLTTLTANAFLTGGGAATAPNAVVLTGIIKGNGASAPTAVTAPSGAIVGTTDTQTLSAKTLTGTTTNDSAPAGAIGEYITGSATAVALTSTTQTNITSISLTAGDWDVGASIKFNPAATTTSTIRSVGVTTTSATMPTVLADDTAHFRDTGAITAGQGRHVYNTGMARISLAGTTTVYCVAQATFATSTMTADGLIRARRVR